MVVVKIVPIWLHVKKINDRAFYCLFTSYNVLFPALFPFVRLDIIQHILDLVSSQSQDVSALAAGIQGSGSNSENSDNLQTESGLFEAAILGNIDEEAVSLSPF